MPKLKTKVIPGSILWVRYSFAPNRLKYCGPPANLTLFEYGFRRFSDKGLEQILAEFEAAYPYIQFIAQENKIADPFDWRVVEAYWLGNELLKKISLNKFYEHLKCRFRKRVKSEIFSRIANNIPKGAKPFHAFHVLGIYQEVGTTREIDLGPVLETMNNCLVGWGKVVGIQNDKLEVEYRPLMSGKNLFFGPASAKIVKYKFEGKSLIDEPQVGDWVSIHWNWACDILDERQLKTLQKWTLWLLKIATLNYTPGV